MTSVLVGRKKLAAEIRPDKTLPHQKERCEFSHITLRGGGGRNQRITRTQVTIKAPWQQPASHGFFCLFSHFAHYAFTNAPTLLAVSVGFSTFPITAFHAAIPNQFHSSTLDSLLFWPFLFRMDENKHKQAYDSGKVCPHIQLIISSCSTLNSRLKDKS